MTDVTAQPAPLPVETTSSPIPAIEPTSLIAAATVAPPVAEAPAPLTAEAVTLPEGFTLDTESMTTFLSVMNDAALTPAARAQALIDLQAGLTTKSSEMGSQAWADQQAAWQAEITADPVLGGANFEKTMQGIGNLMDRFADDGIRAAFNDTGAGNNPHIVRFLSTLVAQLREPTPIPPGGAPLGGAARSLEERIYGQPTA